VAGEGAQAGAGGRGPDLGELAVDADLCHRRRGPALLTSAGQSRPATGGARECQAPLHHRPTEFHDAVNNLPLSVTAARADALFASALQRSNEPSVAQIAQAIAAAVRAFRTRGCAARAAQAYGEQPETAGPRMRWARVTIAAASGGAHPQATAPGVLQAHRSGICRAA